MADTPFQVADLPPGLEPGVYVSIRTDGEPGLSAPDNKCLLLAYMSAGGTGVPNQPYRALSRSDVDAAFKPYSMAARAFAAAKAAAPVGAEIHILPLLEPSGGTAQIVKVEITGEPSQAGVLSSATTAAAADIMTILYAGRGIQVGIKAGDSWATVATNAEAAWNLLEDAPAVISRSSAELSFTARHKGAFDDGALEVSFASKGASGIAAFMGTVAFSGAAGVASAGSYTLAYMDESMQATILDTGTAAASATALVNKVQEDSHAFRAAQPSSPSGTVTLFYVSGRPIRPLSITGTLAGVTTQTATLTRGTAGAGQPTLTSALANLAASDEAVFRAWSAFTTGATEMGTIATHIAAQDAVPFQKGQIVIICLTGSLSSLSSTNLPEATSPKLSASGRFPVMWARNAPLAGWELSARLAASIAAAQYVAKNWNGYVFKGSNSAPCPVIAPADRPDIDERTTVIGLRHAPIAVNSAGQLALVWGGNSYKSKSTRDKKLTKISTQLTLDYYRSDLRNTFGIALRAPDGSGLKIKTASDPRTAYATTTRAVEGIVYRWAKRLDDADLFDGADAKRDSIRAAIVVSPERIDVNIPFAPLSDLDVVAPVGILE